MAQSGEFKSNGSTHNALGTRDDKLAPRIWPEVISFLETLSLP